MCVVVVVQWALSRFARKLRFSPDKVSVFMSIMAAVLNRDRSDGLRTMQGSFDYFKQLVHRHSVERPPHRYCCRANVL